MSDQDNDSMLSLREFCIALYLMERYREGRPLPSVLPGNIIFEETQFPATGQPSAGYGNASWRHNSGEVSHQVPFQKYHFLVHFRFQYLNNRAILPNVY